MRMIRTVRTLSQINKNRCTVEICSIGIVETLHVTMGFRTGTEKFMSSEVFFVVIPFVSFDSQKKDDSGD